MIRNFTESYALLAKFEGGHVHNKHDRGGETNLGVTQKTWHRWLTQNGMVLRSVKTITKAEAKIIAKDWYYKPVRFNQLPDGLDMCVVDFAYNSGPPRATRYLQMAINNVSGVGNLLKVDGAMGAKTLEAARKYSGTALIHQYIDSRLEFFMRQSDAEWIEFGDGWTSRLDKLRVAAISVRERRIDEDAVEEVDHTTASPLGITLAVAAFAGLLYGATWAILKVKSIWGKKK